MLRHVILPVLFILFLGPAFGQTSTHAGIELYKQKNYARAIDSLKEATKSREHKEDPEIWNYLGLAYLADDEPTKAAKAFERSTDLDPSNSIYHTNLAWAQVRAREPGKAIKSADIAVRLGPDNPVAHEVRANIRFLQRNFDGAKADADRFLEIDSSNSRAYLLQVTLLKTKVAEHVTAGSSPEEQLPLLQNAVKILETGLARCGTPGNCTELESGLSAMNSFVRYFERRAGGKYEPSRTPAPTEDGVTPLRITRKPRAEYTDAARRGGVSGNIRILAILGANGKVEHVLLLNSLGYGLDQQVSAAARAIEFEPKKKDGIPVRSLVTLEYVFTIY